MLTAQRLKEQAQKQVDWQKQEIHRLILRQCELNSAEDGRYREMAGLLNYSKSLLTQKDAYLEKVARADNITHLMTKSGLRNGDSLISVVRQQKDKNAKIGQDIQSQNQLLAECCLEAETNDELIVRLQE